MKTKELQVFIHQSMEANLSDKVGLERAAKENKITVVELLVNRVVAHVAAMTGQTRDEISYLLLFSHIFMEYFDYKHIIKQHEVEDEKKIQSKRI